MPQYKYLIIGGGMTGDAAITGIREVEPSAPIGVIGAERHLPYDRPPLSKALWKGKPLDSIWRTKTDRRGVEFHVGRTARQLDLRARTVTDDQGTLYSFTTVLLATGGVPRRLPFGGDAIIYYRTLDDYHRLRGLAEQGRRFLVIGGGFIGSEIAAALAMDGKHVTLALPDLGIGARMYPADLSHFLTEFYREKGVEVITEARVVGLDPSGAQSTARVNVGGASRALDAVDGVVAGIGIQPATVLAHEAGLEIDNGIIVNRELRTSHEHVFAAGDVAAFQNPALGVRIRVEHEDNANTMGRAAGQSMAGVLVAYDHLPFFYSDLFELGYEAVGILDARLETVADWKEPYREGVVYYLRDGRVRGVLLWNTWGQVDAARRLIAEPGPFRPADLTGRLPEKA